MTIDYAPGTENLDRKASSVDKVAETVYLSRQIIGLGVVAGLRSMLPLALFIWIRQKDKRLDEGTALSSFLDAPFVQRISVAMLLGEMLADKLPLMPSRLRARSLFVRLAIGALVGALLYRRSRQSVVAGLALGVAGAGLGAIAGYTGRMLLASLTDIPDAVWGVLEDGVALGLGRMVVDKHARLYKKMQA